MTDEAKLAPCPFCGERATVVYRHNPMSKWKYSADCTSTECGASGPVEANRKDAATAWNTRATDATLRTLRAKIKAMHADLPYFGVPHIREGLEDMLDVIGNVGDENDQS